jgi:E3 ubiquitin-protein ligase UBR3
MNVNERILTDHVEYEPQAYMYAFTIELEISAAALWCFVNHFKPNVSKCVIFFFALTKFSFSIHRIN